MKERVFKLIREAGELRRELLFGEIEEGGIALEFTHQELGTLIYALTLGWITEYVNGQEGYEKMLNNLAEVSGVILAADSRASLEEFLNEVTAGKTNPEEEADGA